jgi:hypothetical protein
LLRFALLRFALLRFALLRFALLRFALLRFALLRFAYVVSGCGACSGSPAPGQPVSMTGTARCTTIAPAYFRVKQYSRFIGVLGQ